MSSGLACTYAALLLFDSNKSVTATDILAVTSAAKITVPKFHAETFAANLDKETLTHLIASLTTPGAGASGEVKKDEKKAEPKKEEKKVEVKKVEEKKEDSDDGGGVGGLFGGDDD
jgi:large subunit ribosomal protein LP1